MAKSKKTPAIPKLTSFERIMTKLESPFTYEFSFNYTSHKGEEEYAYESIDNVSISEFSFSRLIDSLGQNFLNLESIEDYCLLRMICCISKDDFECYAQSDYYGDQPAARLKQDVKDKIKALSCLTGFEAIKYTLLLEYGYILPVLETISSWGIIKANAPSIFMPSENLYIKLDRSKVECYKELFTKQEYRTKAVMAPNCLCIYTGKELRLIDGRHRYVAAKELGLELTVICGSNCEIY